MAEVPFELISERVTIEGYAESEHLAQIYALMQKANPPVTALNHLYFEYRKLKGLPKRQVIINCEVLVLNYQLPEVEDELSDENQDLLRC